MHKLRELKIWNKANDLVLEVYRLTKHFPKDEMYGLTSQVRRAVISIPSNIAEGAGRDSDKEFARFLSISNGSAYEVQTQVILAERLNYVQKELTNSALKNLDEIQRMNYSLKKRLSQ